MFEQSVSNTAGAVALFADSMPSRTGSATGRLLAAAPRLGDDAVVRADHDRARSVVREAIAILEELPTTTTASSRA